MTGRALIRTLVVDDDFRVAAIHTAYVGRVEGFEAVGVAHGAAEALAANAALQPDLILLDLYLPDGDGLSVVRQLLAHHPHPDVLVITAARDIATVRTAMQLGAVHYLVKPFGFAALCEVLRAYHQLRLRIADLTDEADQSDVDELFSLLRPSPEHMATPAKGHSALTLDMVRNAVLNAEADVSAGDVAQATGMSRATAQRYLTYLSKRGILRVQLRYGSTGRPEHRYSPVRPR